MFARAKRWIRSKQGLSNAVQVSPQLTLLVPPTDGWDAANVAATQRWLETVNAKQGAENTLVFCSSCSGLLGRDELGSIADDAVQLGKESHFCPPQIAPEFKTTLALCRSVATWLRTEDAHVAVVAVSRQRAALLAVCIDTIARPGHECDSAAALFRQLRRQFFTTCDRVRDKVAECRPLRAHQLFLKNWSRMLFERSAEQSPLRPLRQQRRPGVPSPQEAAVLSWGPDGPARVKEVIVSGLRLTSHEKPVVMISLGELLVFSSLNGSPPRQGGRSRSRSGAAAAGVSSSPLSPSAGSSSAASASTRVPVGRTCAADADLVLRVYVMADATMTGRPTQRLLCSISFNAMFAEPPVRLGGAAATADGDGGGGGGGSAAAGAVSPAAAGGEKRVIAVTAADLDDPDVPGSFHLEIVFSNEEDDDEEEEGEEEGGGGDHSGQLPEPAGIAIPGAAAPRGGGGGGAVDDSVALAYSLDDDAALALSLQRHFDLEARAAGLPPSPHSPPDIALGDGAGGGGEGGAEDGGEAAAAASEGGDAATAAAGGSPESSGSPGTARASASASAGAGAAASASLSSRLSDVAGSVQSAGSTASAEEQLATDEAFARALQEEYNRAASAPRRRRSGGGGAAAAAMADPEALARVLHDDAAEFLRMVVGGGAPGQQRRLSNAPHCVATLPTGTVGPAQLGNECQVCFETYTLGETFRTLPCMHIYHKECIDPWLLSKRVPTCPVCLTKVEH